MPMKLMTGAALVAAVLAGATPAEAQSFQNLVDDLLRQRISSSPDRRDKHWRA